MLAVSRWGGGGRKNVFKLIVGLGQRAYRPVYSYAVGRPFRILLVAVTITDNTYPDWYLVNK